MSDSYNPFILSGKTILVTGATSGIGRSTAIECSRMGAKVIITGRNIQNLNDTFGQLQGTGHDKYSVDLTVEEDVNNWIKEIKNIDGLVHSAGLLKTIPFQFTTTEELNRILEINFVAPVLLSKKLIKSKKIKKGGSIVFISSIEGSLVAHIGKSMYAASKGAVTAIARSMAVELAQKNIRVNSISPGMVETPLIQTELFTNEQIEADKNLYPLKRYGRPEEIAYSIVFLLSDASSWTTGTNLIVDGGFTLL